MSLATNVNKIIQDHDDPSDAEKYKLLYRECFCYWAACSRIFWATEYIITASSTSDQKHTPENIKHLAQYFNTYAILCGFIIVRLASVITASRYVITSTITAGFDFPLYSTKMIRTILRICRKHHLFVHYFSVFCIHRSSHSCQNLWNRFS